jgi:alanine-synthesizing transaminase
MVQGKSPIRPARRMKDVRYAVRDVLLTAAEAKAAGKDMIYLNIGDPLAFDFHTPPHIVAAIERALRDNRNGYAPSAGIPEALEAIRREAERKSIREVRDVFITYGASEAIEIALTALVDSGDDVLLPNPGYPLYSAILSKLEATQNPYLLDEENGWQPHLADIAQRVGPRTRAIVLINPNNPTGVLYERKILDGILEIARRHDLVVLCDEIYDKLILDEETPHVSIASLAADVPVITFNGLSKSYLGPGLRIGWGVTSGPAHLFEDYSSAMMKLTRARLCASHPLQYGIKPALEGPQDHLPVVKKKLRQRRDITHQRLSAIEGVSCVRPNAAFYAFPRIDVPVPDEEFTKELILETGVVPVHGGGFGQKAGTAHLRIVFLPQPELLARAYERLEGFFLGFRARQTA